MTRQAFVVGVSDEGANLLDTLRRAGVAVPAPCGGSGTCGKCKVMVQFPGATQAEEVLACQTEARAGMSVHLDTVALTKDMDVSVGASAAMAQPSLAPDEDGAGLGVAFDVGTTTLVCRLYDMRTGAVLANVGAPNPQGAFGADVISRISAVADGHLKELCGCVNDALADLVKQACMQAGRDVGDICQAALCGNTVMEHLVTGLDPSSIGVAPFTPLDLFGGLRPLPALEAAGCGVREAQLAPCIAGYVGGDITADMLACGMGRADETVLLLDLGTNGEMALSTPQGILTCATAAGPVFEGANIQYGMPAYPGAVSQVSFDGDELRVRTIGDATACGICGTGLIDALALLLRFGVVDESGCLLEADELDDEVPACIASRVGEHQNAPAFWVTPDIAVTQKDVRNIQLAKAAIFAGVRTLLDAGNVALEDVGRLVVAGGFGQFLDLENAARIGLFPEELLPVAQAVGNTAIEGAGDALVSSAAREEIARLGAECGYVELSESAAFNAAYVDAMEFPEA